MFERFTDEARTVVVEAQEECRRVGSAAIGTEHLLLGLWSDDGSPAVRALEQLGLERENVRNELAATGAIPDAAALRTLGIDLEAVRERVEAAFGRGALDRRSGTCTKEAREGRIPFTRQAKRALELSLRACLELSSRSIRTEHVLIGIVDADDVPVARLLARHGLDAGAVRRAVLAELPAD
jgi:ATP-dependent Clp protease ATP-binding subunit ClpA